MIPYFLPFVKVFFAFFQENFGAKLQYQIGLSEKDPQRKRRRRIYEETVDPVYCAALKAKQQGYGPEGFQRAIGKPFGE